MVHKSFQKFEEDLKMQQNMNKKFIDAKKFEGMTGEVKIPKKVE
jgi:hypothetical protein